MLSEKSLTLLFDITGLGIEKINSDNDKIYALDIKKEELKP